MTSFLYYKYHCGVHFTHLFFIWFQLSSTLFSKLFIKLWFCGQKCIISHIVLSNPPHPPIQINIKAPLNHKPLIIIYLVTYDFLILLVTKLYMFNGIVSSPPLAGDTFFPNKLKKKYAISYHWCMCTFFLYFKRGEETFNYKFSYLLSPI